MFIPTQDNSIINLEHVVTIGIDPTNTNNVIFTLPIGRCLEVFKTTDEAKQRVNELSNLLGIWNN